MANRPNSMKGGRRARGREVAARIDATPATNSLMLTMQKTIAARGRTNCRRMHATVLTPPTRPAITGAMKMSGKAFRDEMPRYKGLRVGQPILGIDSSRKNHWPA